MDFNLEKFKQIYDREVVKMMRDSKVPGFSVLITRDGETIYERSYGSRKWQGTRPADSDTLYGIASITKSMTSVAILQLVEQGKLSLDDPISKHIPVHLGSEDHPILVRHLMSHASGIPNLGSYATPIKNEELTDFKTENIPMANWDDFYFHINDAQDWVISEPGTKFYYCNDGYTLLSQIIAKVSGMSYEQYMRTHVFDLLDMKRSTYSREDLEKDDNVAAGYSTKYGGDGIERKPKPHLSGQFNSGAGGLNSSVRELTNYLQLHLNEGSFKGQQLLASDLIREMWKPHNQHLTSEKLYLPGDETGYGYGLAITEDFYGHTLIQHGGASGVAGGIVAFIPELNITYVHLYNVGWFTSHMMYIALLSLLGKDPYQEILYLRRREHFRKLCGTYENYRKMISYEIKDKGGLLHVEGDVITKFSNPLMPVDIHAAEPLEFYEYNPSGRMLVRFTLHDDGKITLEHERNLMRKVSYRDDLEQFD